jgi:hypothetical protein
MYFCQPLLLICTILILAVHTQSKKDLKGKISIQKINKKKKTVIIMGVFMILCGDGLSALSLY